MTFDQPVPTNDTRRALIPAEPVACGVFAVPRTASDPLRRAAPFLRSQAAAEMRLRVAPTLSFQPDTTLDNAMEIDALLRSPEVARDLD